MAPNRENIASSISSKTGISNKNFVHQKPPRLSNDTLLRTKSDFISELSRNKDFDAEGELAPVAEVEDGKCECCGMSEEFTPEYINRVREKFSGKMICGLCAEAVNEEMEKNGGKSSREEALNEHMSACVSFNRFGRTHPVLFQAEAMREILKNSRVRAKSISPRDKKVTDNKTGGALKKAGGLARSSSCIPALTKQINDLKIVN